MNKGDLTQGSVFKQLILFSIPIVMGELFQNFYNSVDAFVVGNLVGDHALAAVSVCETPAQLIVGFFNGMSLGASVVTARAFGSGDWRKTQLRMRTCFTAALVLGVLLSVAGVLCAPLLLAATNVDDALFTEAVRYLRIYMAGLMFMVIYNIAAGILRAIGDTRSPFLILVVSCCVNIVFDLMLVGLDMGVAGVALATVFAQSISAVLAYRRIRHMSADFRISVGEIRTNWKAVAEMFSIGFPSGLQSSLVFLSNMFVWRYINAFDPGAIAGIGIAQRLDKFVAMPCKAFGLAVTTFVGQNVGAGNCRRCREGTAKALALSLLTVAVIGSVLYAFTEPCVAIFNRTERVIHVGTDMMHVIIPTYIVMTVREILIGALRGYGNARVPMLLSLLGMIGVRQIYLALAMHVAYRVEYIYYCYPIAWTSTAVMLLLYYLFYRRRQKCSNEK